MADKDFSCRNVTLRRVFLALLLSFALVLCSAPFALAEPGESEQSASSDTTQNSSTTDSTIRVGYYAGDPAFQDGFSDDEHKTGYAYVYYQYLAPLTGWDYDYLYFSSYDDAVEALINGNVDIVAGVQKTPALETSLLFSESDMGLPGEQLYFAVDKDRADLMADLNAANTELLTNSPNFLTRNWQEFYGDKEITATLTDEQYTWLKEKGSLKLGYLDNNLPVSGQGSDGEIAGAVSASIPLLENYLGIPIETIAYDSYSSMADALLNNEIDIIFPIYSDQWIAESEGLYQTSALLEEQIAVAYTGDYDDQIFARVAVSEASIGRQMFLAQYGNDYTIALYPNRTSAFDAVMRGEATCVIGSANILQFFLSEHSEYSNFNMVYLDGREGFSFAVSRDNPTLAIAMEEAIQQVDDTTITNALIRYSQTQASLSMLDLIKQNSLQVLVAIMLIVMLIIITFIRYRHRMRTITQQQAAAQVALEAALTAADNASTAKTSFLSSMSHDIRTPLNAILGMTAIAGANLNDTNRVKDCLSKIASSGKHLLALINEILDISKIESGRIELSEEPFDLSTILKDLLDINKSQADAKGLKIVLRVKDVIHEEVIGDSMRLQQIFTNLVSNAVKYTQPGGTIDITLVEKNAGKSTLAQYDFIVKDNGIGISEDYLPHLFEAFSRAEDENASEQQGTGLGLPIALSTARMMNGDIKVESELGKGSTFTATVYLKIAELNPSVYKNLAGLKVLMVDDDESMCESTCITLNKIGMNCDYVLSGLEAVQKLAASEKNDDPYFAVIVDWIMPDMDGVETIRQIRANTSSNAVIIVTSAYDWSENEEEAREAGAAYFVSKPLFKSRLTYLFTQIIEEKTRTEPSDLQALTGEVDFTGKRALLAEDNELNAEVACAFLGMTGLEVEHALNGEIAVRMVEEHEPGYYDCIFMDMQMPVMDGCEASAAIRALDRTDTNYSELPIFAMTANAFVDDIRKTRDAGMNEHFAKPLDFSRVIQTVRTYLGKPSN